MAYDSQIVHYGQEVASGGFNMYDFGDEDNMMVCVLANDTEYRVV